MAVKPWITAFRLRTLPLAFSGILVGTSLAASATSLNYGIAGLTLLTAILLQILSNLANDYGDAVSGVDSDKRKGPDRMVQAGMITKTAMRNALILFSLLSLSSGVLLIYLSFGDNWPTAGLFLVIGLAAIAAAIKYTVGKNPYGYAGFGDLFVFLFFGLVAVAGTFFLQTQTVDLLILLPASTLGLFAVGVLNVNNVRDIESDAQSGKHSIPVRIGKRKAAVYHALLLAGGILCSLIYVVLSGGQSWSAYLFLLSTPLFFINAKAVLTKESAELDPFLKQMAISTLLFSILFAVGQFL